MFVSDSQAFHKNLTLVEDSNYISHGSIGSKSNSKSKPNTPINPTSNSNPKNQMKPKTKTFYSSAAAAFAIVTFTMSSIAQAQTWDGGGVDASWGTAGNWNADTLPTFGTTADLSFPTDTGLASGTTTYLGVGRQVRSLTFGADVDTAFGLILSTNSTTLVDARLTFANTTANSINVLAGSTGNINIGNPTNIGSPPAVPASTLQISGNLTVNHNGTGLLTFSRPLSTTSALNFTKTGSGPMQTNNSILLTGALNINQGTLIANSFSSTGADLASFTAINLGGGTLQIGASGTSGGVSSGTAKTYATGPITVGSASTLEYKNITPTTYNAAFTGTGFTLNADLAVNNTSTDTTLTNAFSINRPVTGVGKITSSTYNNITASTDNFALGRVSLGSDNATWNGGITISKGTFLLGGTTVNSAGTGLITIGTAADTFGAGLTFSPGGAGGSTIIYPNNIKVNTGGFRAIKGGNTNHTVTFSGNVTLDKDLTVDHTWSTADRRIQFTGPISGAGGLTFTRAAGSTATTARLTGANNYTGATLVSSTASLALASTCSLTSNITVQSDARIGGPGSTTGTLTLESGAKFFFFYSVSYIPMNVTGAVSANSSFGISSLVGGSQGEAVPWATIPDGTYTLIGTTASTFNTISNFGLANAAVNVASSGKTAYFQNGGGTGGGGLQLVITTAVADPFTTWSGGAAFNVDTNNDGVGNGLAFLLGAASVNANANGLLPAPTQSGGDLTLTFSMLNSASRGTTSLQVQHSNDLGISDPWSTLVTVPDTTSSVGGINFTVSAATASLNSVTATIPASGNAAGGKLFGRVKANP